MENADVVHSQIEEQAFQVHRVDRLAQVLGDYIG